MHVDHNVEEFKPPFTEDSLRAGAITQDTTLPLTSTHINALSTCLTAIDGIFMTFMSIDIETVRDMPVIHFIRVAYAVVVLIKMYFAAAIEGSELGKVIDKDNMRVEYYLESLLTKFRSAAAEDKSRPSAKFLMVVIMLKTWFHRQRAGKQAGKNGGNPSPNTEKATPRSSDEGQTQLHSAGQVHQQQQKQEYSPVNTPLQLLSEVATGGNSTRPQSHTQLAQQGWQGHPYGYNTPAPISYDGGNTPYGMSNIDPSLAAMSGADFNVGVGNGLEQTMGMTLGENDFQYFNDDAFFGVVMESMDATGGVPDFFGGF